MPVTETGDSFPEIFLTGPSAHGIATGLAEAGCIVKRKEGR